MTNITIHTTPPQLALAGNGLKYKVSSDNVLSAAGAFASITCVFTASWDMISADDNIEIATELFTINFIFKLNPDNSGNQLPIPASYPDNFVAFAHAVRAAMNKNYYLNRYTTLAGDPDQTTWQFIFNKKANNHIVLTVNASGGTNFSSSSGSDTVIRPNYKLCAAAFMPEYLITLEKFPIPHDQQLEFDFEFLKNIASADFTMSPTSPFIAHDNAIIAYLIKFFEQYGEPPASQALLADQTRYFIPGGADANTLHEMDVAATDYLQHIIDNQRFLTNADDEITIKTTDILRLYWILNTTNNVKLYATRYDGNDNIVGIPVFTVANINSDNYKLYEIVLDPLLLFTAEQLAVTHYILYKLRDTTANEDISVVRKYYINDNISDQRMSFVFQNSFGVAYDSIFAYGKAEHSIELDNYTLLKIDKTKSQSRSGRQDRYIIRSGHISFRDLFYWQEFIQSPERYLIRDARRIPVRITSMEVFIYKNREYNFGIELSVELDNQDFYRSSLPDQAFKFSDFFNTYGYSFVVPAAGGGHVIVDPDGNEMPQRKYLQFKGALTVTDDEANDKTIVEVPSSNTGIWWQVNESDYSLNPWADDKISTITDLRDLIKIDDVISWMEDTTRRAAIVSAITDSLITVVGDVLDPSYEIKSLKTMRPTGTTVTSFVKTIAVGDWIHSIDLSAHVIIDVPGFEKHYILITSPDNPNSDQVQLYILSDVSSEFHENGKIKLFVQNPPTINLNVKITYIWQ